MSQLARSKRVSSKTKDSTNNVLPIKSTHTPESVSSTTVLPKTSARSELIEQCQDLSRSTDSINDQQWRMVSSNRNLRKGTSTNTTTNKKETIEESQTTNKTTKTNSGKMILVILTRTYSNFIN